jgi:PAS domain S-box-containing protein
MKKILAIDDKKLNLKFIKSFLSKNNPDYQVLIAQSGEEGIKIAKEESPDTILLDILMPEMDSFEVCKILKNDEITKYIPVLMVSALGQDPETRIRGLNAGADAFISKPFDKAELKALLNIMLRIKQAEDLLRKRNENLEIFIKKQTKEFNNCENRCLEILEYAIEYFWEVDSNGLFTYICPVIEKMLGYKSDEIIGKKHLFDFPQSKDKQKIKVTLFHVFKNRNNYKENEILCLHKNGKKIWLKISGFPIFDKKSNFIGYRGVTHDITLRRQAEEDQKKSLEEIKAYQKKLKTLNSELTNAEEKERRRIAVNLHDVIGQTLSIAHIKLSSLSNIKFPPKVKKIISESSELIHAAITESNSLTYDLSPPILYELGLIPAIKWRLEQIEEKFGIVTNFKSSENRLDINNDIRILLYRIICELLTNIIKHANADFIRIEISKDQKYFYITVFDNGQGFNYQPESELTKQGGFGLFTINERLDSIQGQFVIESEKEKGTKAIVSIPI